MTVSASEAALSSSDASAPAVIPGRLPRWFEDHHGWIAAALYLLLALFYQRAVIGHISTLCNCSNTDPTQWMWAWEYLSHAILHGQNPLVTNDLWWPNHTDLAAVTLAPLSAIPGAPLEALFGPVAAYNILSLACPVLSAWAAYRLCRYLSGAPWASILAGYTFGFSAYEFGQMLGHLHLMFVFAVPMLILTILRYVDGDFSARRAVVSATVLLVIQFGLSTEILFDLAYLGIVTLIVAFVCAPAQRRKLLGLVLVLGVALLITGALWSYYIIKELQGPTPTKGAGAFYPADLLSYVFPTKMFRLGGNRFLDLSNSFFTSNSYEENSYLGLPLVGIFLAFAIGYWRRPAAKIIVVASLVAGILSLGQTLEVGGHPAFELPFNVLAKAPFFDLLLPARLGLFVGLGAAAATALWISWADAATTRIWRWIVALAAIAFLVPNLPATEEATAYVNPTFFTHGTYKHYIARNEPVLTIPNASIGDEMLWQTESGLYFKLVGGYFGNGPPGYGISSAAQALIYQLSVNTLEPTSVYASELRSITSVYHVKTVLLEDSASGAWTTGTWPAAMRQADFRMAADVGGIQVWKTGVAAASR